MITVSPATNGVLGAYEAFNEAGDRIEGKFALDPNGSGEAKFVPDAGYGGDRYEQFLAAERSAVAKGEST